MYIIERPKYTKGIYIILNIIKNKAYIGLSKDMASRTRQHLVIECEKEEEQQDNSNLINEDIKCFWSFMVAYVTDFQREEEIKEDLERYETLFMYILKNSGFKLYNKSKNKTCTEMVRLLETKFPTDFQEVKSKALESLNEDLKCRFGKTLDEISSMVSERERKACWEKAVEKLTSSQVEKIDYFKLDMNDKDFYKKYREACKILNRPRISKEKAKEIGITWGERSILDPELNLDKMAIISKFGSHNREYPYEILLKKQMDLKNSKCCIWALRNFNEKWVRKVASSSLKEGEDLYAILLYTSSDITTEGKMDLDKVVTEDEIYEKDQRFRETNPQELMNYWRRDKEEGWIPIDDKITYITLPESRKKKAVGLLISDMWFAKEGFNSIDFPKYFNAKVECWENTPWEKQEADIALKRNSACVRLKSYREFQELLCKEHDMIDCIIAKLEYPYVVELQHDLS